jgi:hypothetical protein
MKHLVLIAALLATLGLAACNKPAEVAPSPPPAAEPAASAASN